MNRSLASAGTAGDALKAIELYKISLKTNPEDAEILFALGRAYFKLCDYEESVAAFKAALIHAPEDYKYYADFGLALKACGNLGEAEAILRHAIYLAPGAHLPHMSLANLLIQRGREREAESLYRAVIASQPRFVGAYQNLGNLLLSRDRTTEAITLAREMVTLAPSDVRAHAQLSVALERGGKLSEALNVTRDALQLNASPHLDMTTASYASLVGLTGDVEARSEVFRKLGQSLSEGQPGVPNYQIGPADFSALRRFAFLFPYYGIADIDHRRLIEFIGINIERPARKYLHERVNRNPMLRVGFLSYNFGDHPIGHLLSPFFEAHAESNCELYLYALNDSNHDNSEYPTRIRRAAKIYKNLSLHSDDEAAKVIFDDEINILVDLDGYLGGGRPGVLARHPAPVQIHWLQHLSGMPAPFIDYTILDKTICRYPEGYEFNSNVIRLDSAFQCGDRIELPSTPPSRSSVGLPSDKFVFCGFNSWLKIDDMTFSCWMEILKAVPSSVLWLSSATNQGGPSSLLRAAKAAGIDSDRLIFAQRLPDKRKHLDRHRCADLFLDTFAFSASTTAVDALWAGLPVLTLSGKGSYSRLSASLLTAVNLKEMIVYDQHSYVEMAVLMARDSHKLSNIRSKLGHNRRSSKLFDSNYLARQFGVIYERCWLDFTSRNQRSFDISADGLGWNLPS